ncbi:MAG: hypothetical protein ABI210_13525 [Abditibacteriaceae bacterium]
MKFNFSDTTAAMYEVVNGSIQRLQYLVVALNGFNMLFPTRQILFQDQTERKENQNQ